MTPRRAEKLAEKAVKALEAERDRLEEEAKKANAAQHRNTWLRLKSRLFDVERRELPKAEKALKHAKKARRASERRR